MRGLFSFPNPVNEVSARLVAAGVVVMCVLTIAFDLRWATVVIAYGFVARVLSGPTLSPLGQFVDAGGHASSRARASARWPGRPSASPRPSASSSRVTALVLTGAGLLDGGRGLPRPARRRRVPGVGLRPLPRLQGLCVLMRAGVVPEEVCERCNDIWATHRGARPTAAARRQLS